MDAKLTGRFIADLRKERGLTQEELAGELNVTNKAVSRWETGAGFPDVDSMMALSAFFGVSVNELLLGRRSAADKNEAGSSVANESEQNKKEMAQIACDSLDLSIKKRRISRAAKILAVLLAAVIVLGAVLIPILARKEKPDVVQYENDRYFSPYTSSLQPDSPAKIIDIKTGEVIVACPDPLCDHSASSETCFFNYSHDKTKVFAVQYANGHIFFVAEKHSADGSNMRLYDYSMESGRIEEIYTFGFPLSTLQLYTNGSKAFFTSLIEGGGIEDDSAKIGLFEYDPNNGAVTLLDGNAKYALSPTDVAFYEDHYIFADGYNDDADRLRYCKRSYDGTSEELFETLPDGTPCEIFGWSLKHNGVFANTWGSGGVYFPADGLKVMFPTDSATTKPTVYKDKIYFTTRSSGFVELGWNPVTKSKAKGYAYDNEIYVLNKDGSYKHYSIDSEYHFIIEAAYESIIIGRIDYRIRENGDYIGDNSYDYIRIDLQTGETTLYNTSARSGFARKTFTTKITINEN